MTGYLDGLFSLDGRVAVVTGGSSGIGAGMAAALARAGARVVLVAGTRSGSTRRRRRCAAAGGEAAWVSADLADRAALARAAEEAAGGVRGAGHPGQLRGGQPAAAAGVAEPRRTGT